MFESALNTAIEPIDQIHNDLRTFSAQQKSEVLMRTVLPWGEHCTECVWPECYKTCALYTPRTDGNCRLFNDGIVRLDNMAGIGPHVLKINFKPWGKLWAVTKMNLIPVERAARLEKRNVTFGTILHHIWLPNRIKEKVLIKYSAWMNGRLGMTSQSNLAPDSFLLECFNPNAQEITLAFTVRKRHCPATRPFQKMITLRPGFNREEIVYSNLLKDISLKDWFEVELIPNDCQNKTLYLIFMDFITKCEKKPQVAKKNDRTSGVEKKCKCIIWDLDNTLWDGILIEDGATKLKVREKAREIIKGVDERGVINSIASKNSYDDAMSMLRQFNLDEYFLYPQINWGPKSQSVNNIAKLLNIGTDTLLFVDDQIFEREEVATAIPEVTVIDASEIDSIPLLGFCDVPVTEESRSRRKMYREQEKREIALVSHTGDYIEFLRECRIRLSLSKLCVDQIDRVFELIQRTNQMNFSGNRYPRNEIEAILKDEKLETYVMKCEDKHGSYGIIGFAVIDICQPRLLDLMFSCRIQGKKVDDAFLSYLLKRYKADGHRAFFANYRKTAKNIHQGKIFADIGFKEDYIIEGVTSLSYSFEKEIPDLKVVEIDTEE